MKLIEVFMIGIALAMDAFGVSLGIGIVKSKNLLRDKKTEYLCIFMFGFFQFLFAFAGGIVGSYISNNIIMIPSKLIAAVIFIVGTLMIYDGKKKKSSYHVLKKGMIIILGASVSIDALAVGFTTFSFITSPFIIFIYSVIIGLITSFLCSIAFVISTYIAKINLIAKYSNYIGGIILIIIAIKTYFNL